jgi:hypothetical protein
MTECGAPVFFEQQGGSRASSEYFPRRTHVAGFPDERIAIEMKRTDTAGGRLKAALLADFEFAEAELVIVEEACRVADILERIETELGSALLLTAGSRGQAVENPLLRSARDHGAHLIKLLTALGLPGVEDESESPATAAARKAALIRWHGRAS